jgi:hypothetical protein
MSLLPENIPVRVTPVPPPEWLGALSIRAGAPATARM